MTYTLIPRNFSNKTILITGAAGFIGFSLIQQIIKTNNNSVSIIGLDSLNDYYDITLKENRLSILHKLSSKAENPSFTFIKGNLVDKVLLNSIFNQYKPQLVVNLAAQAGVRYSITNPEVYIESNLVGFFNLLEACRYNPVEHLVYASSSSVYGSNKKVPYSIGDKVDNPVSLYAATKKSNELLAHAYSKLYNIPTTGLRFFTVYGPFGRPDMAYYSFTDKMVKGHTIQIYNNGDMYRDFTYIEDIITGVINVMGKAPVANEEDVKFKLYNIGNNQPEKLMYFVDTLERCLMTEGIIDKPAEKEFLPMQPGDVYQTYADVTELINDFGFKPNTSLEEGLSRFVKWYKEYYMK